MLVRENSGFRSRPAEPWRFTKRAVHWAFLSNTHFPTKTEKVGWFTANWHLLKQQWQEEFSKLKLHPCETVSRYCEPLGFHGVHIIWFYHHMILRLLLLRNQKTDVFWVCFRYSLVFQLYLLSGSVFRCLRTGQWGRISSWQNHTTQQLRITGGILERAVILLMGEIFIHYQGCIKHC